MMKFKNEYNEIIRKFSKVNSRKLKGTVLQIEKALINDCLLVSKASWKCCIPTINNFAGIYP